MSYILFHGSQESLEHISDRLRHHRLRRDPNVKQKSLAPQALIVDDDVESVQPLQVVLKNFGFETTLVFDGKEALNEIARKSFDLVFMDICMPEMTGIEVLEKVETLQRHDQRFSQRSHPLPVVTYSSRSFEELQFPEGRNFFIADHWQKPLSLSDLASMAELTLEDLGFKAKKQEA